MAALADRVSRTRCIKPDFVLIRNECRGVLMGKDNPGGQFYNIRVTVTKKKKK